MAENQRAHTTRLESLTDTVFGFSIALLIVSVDVPQDFTGLMDIMRGFAGFALSFAMIILVWMYHYRFFRDYKLEDSTTIVLNAVLLFVVLFYVYPLKYVVTVVTTLMGGEFLVTVDEVAILMAIYSIGFSAVFGVFALMYRHALKNHASLGLGTHETITASEHVSSCMIMTGVGLLSVLLALLLPSPLAGPVAGFSYFLIGPAQWINSQHYARKRMTPDSSATEPGASDQKR
ncbi:MAG: TMEM175 family protein [Pseudohongiella sp.]|nr:TMEM175 family protein [Pseudohongiella sp.]